MKKLIIGLLWTFAATTPLMLLHVSSTIFFAGLFANLVGFIEGRWGRGLQ